MLLMMSNSLKTTHGEILGKGFTQPTLMYHMFVSYCGISCHLEGIMTVQSNVLVYFTFLSILFYNCIQMDLCTTALCGKCAVHTMDHPGAFHPHFIISLFFVSFHYHTCFPPKCESSKIFTSTILELPRIAIVLPRILRTSPHEHLNTIVFMTNLQHVFPSLFSATFCLFFISKY